MWKYLGLYNTRVGPVTKQIREVLISRLTRSVGWHNPIISERVLRGGSPVLALSLSCNASCVTQKGPELD